MGECGRCRLPFRGRSLKRVQTGTHFGKPIYRLLCSLCRKITEEENKKENK